VQAPDVTILELAAEVQLAETQDQCIEMAVDAGELHADIQALQEELAAVRSERDAWVAAMRHQPLLCAAA
jgi:hypothetical protein